MVNNESVLITKWSETLALFKLDEVRIHTNRDDIGKVRAAISRVPKSSGKRFTTNTLLSGGFEIKRTK